MRRSVRYKKDNLVVIVGAGPAGIAAAIQLRHCGIDPLVFEKGEPGGLLRNANFVENYPGFPEGISGRRLVEILKDQLRRAGVRVLRDEVRAVEYKNKIFFIRTRRDKFNAGCLVVASGTEPRRLEGVKVSASARKRIFYEVVDLPESKDTVGIIGAGDAAFDYALNLKKRKPILIFNRSSRIKCIPSLFNAVLSQDNIKYIPGIKIKKVSTREKGLVLLCQSENGNKEFVVSYLLAAIGRKPAVKFLSPSLARIKKKLVAQRFLYFVGDVHNGRFRQTAIAVGDGIKAGLSIYQRFLKER